MDELARVAVLENEPAAELAAGLLETEGIRVLWQKSASAGPFPWVPGALTGIAGPFEILVRAEDAERAHELLNSDADT